MAYIPSECTIKEYTDRVYDADAKHKCYLAFNDEEYEDIDTYLQKITINSNCLDTTKKVFMLNNLISKSIDITVRDFDTTKIKDKITLKIGTYINDEIGYVYIPIGVFNLQEKPTTSDGVTTIKARDNASLLDKPYNAKPLIDENDGVVTKLQILQDICTKFGITCNVTSFRGSDEQVGIYDSTINARNYVSWLAEQSSCIAYINRLGALEFKPINNLYKWSLPFKNISKYTGDLLYKVSKVIYGDGLYQYPLTETSNDILYLDVNNPYVTSQEIVQGIYEIANDFSISSFKVEKIYGNACIDAFDLIEVVDNDVSYETLAQNTLIYNGKLMHSFDTPISREKKETNITITPLESYKRSVKIELDNVQGQIKETVSKVDTIDDQTAKNNTAIQEAYNSIQEQLKDYALQNDLLNIENSVTRLTTDTYTKEQIQQIVKGMAEDGTEVSYVKTTSATMDENGLTIDRETTGEENTLKANLDTTGVKVINKKTNNNLLEAIVDEETGESIVRSDNLYVSKYFVISSMARLEKYKNNRVGCFWTGD